MKTKLFSILVLVSIMISCTTKEQKANNEFRQYSLNDDAFSKYLNWENKTDSIKEAVVTLAQLYLNEGRVDILDTVLLAYCDAVGVKEVAKYLSSRDNTRYAWPDYPPKEIMDIVLENNDLKSTILAKTIHGHDLKSALWTFHIDPNVVVDRLSPSNTWYSPGIRGEIKRKLIEYYNDSMGENIAIQIANITPDKTLTNYMGKSIESAIFKVNPSRITQIYSKMSAYQISSYAEHQSKCFEIGERAYLNANLGKVNCDDLAHLKMSGIITEQEFEKYFSKRPKSEKQSFNTSIWEGKD